MSSINRKIKVGILGATGMVGQRFVSFLANHPWFEVAVMAASPQSAGKTYQEAIEGRWAMYHSIPDKVREMKLKSVEEDFDEIVKEVNLVFSAIDMDPVRNSPPHGPSWRASAGAISNGMDKQQLIREIEERYAAAGVAVVSNNSAHRWTEDVPMIIPEINAHHLSMIDAQRKNRDWGKGLLVVKPNCSLQSYLPVVYALKEFKPKYVSVTTLQAISGAGKTFDTWPEMVDNCIPFIKGEEEKTEKEPTKIWGSGCPVISATCIRVAASDGHMASVSVKFENKPTLQQIQDAINNFPNPLRGLDLPFAPEKFIHYFSEDDRPQTKLDRDYANGMGITCGRFREDANGNWRFVALSHNTIRGAAGGAVLIAELLYKKGYLI